MSLIKLMKLENNGIILFDGECNLCNRSVDRVVRNDPEKYFRIASLQSDSGIQLLNEFDIDTRDTDSVILIESNRYYTKSTAALRIARRLRFPYPLLYPLLIVPPFIRNIVYDIIAKNRYKWFGKRDTCRLPTNEEQSYFLP